jgi:hypothetical protein
LDSRANPGSGGGGAGGSGVGAAADRKEKTIVPESIYWFWVDDQRIYWTVYLELTLRSCLKSDCAHTTLAYGKVWDQIVLALGTNDLYWIPRDSPTSVVTCPKAGCRGAPRTFFQDPHAVTAQMAGDGDYLYWNSSFDIYRCPSGGCAATPEVVAANDSVASNIAMHGDHAYWQRPAASAPADAPRVIVRVPKPGTEPPETVLSLTGFREHENAPFVLGRESIYWIEPSGHVRSCPLAGCGDSSPTEHVTSGEPKHSLQVDDTGLYWLETNSLGLAFLHFCEFERCASNESIVVTDKPTYRFVLDDDFVYFGEHHADGSYPRGISRIGKPRTAR